MDQIGVLNKTDRVTKISIVGYSLGGLISRYAIGILYHQGVFQAINPVNFITFCTPHVGVLTPGSNLTVKIFNNLVPALISLSGKQMFLKDHSGSNQGALLSLMASPTSVFYKALSQFKYKSLYANAINDRRTAWWTAGISMVDPFMNIDENSSLNDLNYNFIQGYEPIVLDASSEIIISDRKVLKSEPTTEEIVQNIWIRIWKWIKVVLNILFFAPLWIIWFIISGLMESFKSHRRINSSLKEHSKFISSITSLIIEEPIEDGDDYRTPAESIHSVETNFDFDHNVNSALHDQADTIMESVWDAMTSKEDTLQYDIQYHKVSIPSNDTDELIPGFRSTINELSYFDKDSLYYTIDALKPFIIGLNDEQKEIIKNLDALEWKKFPLLIRHTKSAHSASIVRDINDANFFEGKVVIKHWIENVFRLE